MSIIKLGNFQGGNVEISYEGDLLWTKWVCKPVVLTAVTNDVMFALGKIPEGGKTEYPYITEGETFIVSDRPMPDYIGLRAYKEGGATVRVIQAPLVYVATAAS